MRQDKNLRYVIPLAWVIVAGGAGLADSPGAIADGLPKSVTAEHCYATLTNEQGNTITVEVKNAPPYGQQIYFLNINTEKSVDITYDDIHHVKQVVYGGHSTLEMVPPRPGTFPFDRVFDDSKKYTGAGQPRGSFPNGCDYKMQVPTQELLLASPGQSRDTIVDGQECTGVLTNRAGHKYRFVIYFTDVAAKIELFGDNDALLHDTFVDYTTSAGPQLNNGTLITYRDGKKDKIIPMLSRGPHNDARSAVQSVAPEVIIDSSIPCVRKSFAASSLVYRESEPRE